MRGADAWILPTVFGATMAIVWYGSNKAAVINYQMIATYESCERALK